MRFTTIVTAAAGLGTIAGGVSLLWKWWKWKDHITDGQRCLLRSDMLRIYYRNRETGTIRQYEYENFVYLYNAYKALDGNSFIEKIYSEVKEFEVVS